MHWLSILGAIPLVGAVLVGFVPSERTEEIKRVALGTSLVAFVWTIAMATQYETDGARFQLTERADWIPQFGVHYAVGVDGVSLVLIGLTTVLLPVVLLASWHDVEETGRSVKTFFVLMLATETLLVGVFAATDVFLFYVFFEAMLVPMYFLIGSYGGPQRSYAAVKFLLYSLVGGLLMLAAVIGLYVVSTNQLSSGTFDLEVLSQLHISGDVEKALFLGFFVAFAIKAPLWPFHTWLPDAASEAPTGAAVLLVGVLDKVGTFGMIRYCLSLFPNASETFAPLVITLSVIGIFYGALLAMGQRDIKRLIAYTSVAHFGFIALGIFAFTSQGGAGATLYMVNHGFSTGALFLVAGFLIARRRSRQIDDYGGVNQVAPWLYGAFFVTGLSSLALPGLNSFVSEFLVLVGTFTRYRAAAVLATVGIILAALYILLVIQRTMHGPLKPGNEGITDLSHREAWVIGPVLALIIALGIYPKPLLDVITPTVTATVHQTCHGDPEPSVPAQDARKAPNEFGLASTSERPLPCLSD
jgi:NADH-quinone oxidoreductase subunit M